MPTYSIDQYIQELDRRLNEFEAARDKSVQLAASTALARLVKRVFDDGLPNAEYSTKEMVVRTDKDGNSKSSPKQLSPVQFFPYTTAKRAKYGEPGFYGKKYQGGYKAFKVDIGRGPKVNLRLFGDLQLDFANSLQKDGERYIAGVKRPENGKKVDNARGKYGEVFTHNQDERDEFSRVVQFEMNRYLTGN